MLGRGQLFGVKLTTNILTGQFLSLGPVQVKRKQTLSEKTPSEKIAKLDPVDLVWFGEGTSSQSAVRWE